MDECKPLVDGRGGVHPRANPQVRADAGAQADAAHAGLQPAQAPVQDAGRALRICMNTLQVQEVTISGVRDLPLRGATCPRFGGIVEIRSAVVCPLSILVRYFTFSKSPGFDLHDQMNKKDVYRYTFYSHTESPNCTYGHLLDLQSMHLCVSLRLHHHASVVYLYLHDNVSILTSMSIDRFRYIDWVNCPHRVAGKASALRAGKWAPGSMPIQSCGQIVSARRGM